MLSSVRFLISENCLVKPGKEPHLCTRASVVPLPHYPKLALWFPPHVDNQGESWDPKKLTHFGQKDAILCSEMAHSHILGLINLACSFFCLSLCSLFNSLFTTNCNNLVSQSGGLLWKHQSSKIILYPLTGWRRLLFSLSPFHSVFWCLGMPLVFEESYHFCIGTDQEVKPKGVSCLKDSHVRYYLVVDQGKKTLGPPPRIRQCLHKEAHCKTQHCSLLCGFPLRTTVTLRKGCWVYFPSLLCPLVLSVSFTRQPRSS